MLNTVVTGFIGILNINVYSASNKLSREQIVKLGKLEYSNWNAIFIRASLSKDTVYIVLQMQGFVECTQAGISGLFHNFPSFFLFLKKM